MWVRQEPLGLQRTTQLVILHGQLSQLAKTIGFGLRGKVRAWGRGKVRAWGRGKVRAWGNGNVRVMSSVRGKITSG